MVEKSNNVKETLGDTEEHHLKTLKDVQKNWTIKKNLSNNQIILKKMF